MSYNRTAFVGLVRRDIRRFCACRESWFIYHRARAALMPLAVLPGAALLGVAVCIAAATFQKYL